MPWRQQSIALCVPQGMAYTINNDNYFNISAKHNNGYASKK